jgi:hypothetical protein
MTRQSLLAHATLIQRLRDQTCINASIGYATALLLDFGTASDADPSGYREPELSLVVECPWRLETDETVIVGSGDDDEYIIDAIQSLISCKVEEITIFQPSFTVSLVLGANVLWIFPDDSRAYEDVAEFPQSPWYVTGRGVPSGW